MESSMVDHEIFIEKRYFIKEDFIEDILVTAFEGGINYWCDKVEPAVNPLDENVKFTYFSEYLSKGHDLNIYDEEDCYILTLDNFIKGMKQFLESDCDQYIDDIHEIDIDAHDADRIIQYALFNEIIYG